MSNSAQPTTAPFPFNQDSADIVLRTSDNVHYHIHSIILSQASPFFRDMFSLPQPGKGVHVPLNAHSSGDSSKPIVDMTELSDILYTLLVIIYPVPKPQVTASLTLIEAALAAEQIYELELPIQSLKSDLCAPINLRGYNALHVWAIACCLRFEDVAQYAASDLTLLGLDQLGDPGDAMFRGVSSGDYFLLRSFCRKKLAFSYEPGALSKFAQPLKAESEATSIPALDGAASRTTGRPFRTVPYPDVLVRSSNVNGGEAPAHRCILTMTSPVLRDKLRSKLPVTNSIPLSVAVPYPNSAASTLPILQLDEPSDVLWPLLDTCYSNAHLLEQHASTPCLVMLTRMVAAAEKYEMAHGLSKLRARWHTLAQNTPLDA